MSIFTELDYDFSIKVTIFLCTYDRLDHMFSNDNLNSTFWLLQSELGIFGLFNKRNG